jgi:hypothetical protein
MGGILGAVCAVQSSQTAQQHSGLQDVDIHNSSAESVYGCLV